jgi:hypothetical protein
MRRRHLDAQVGEEKTSLGEDQSYFLPGIQRGSYIWAEAILRETSEIRPHAADCAQRNS